MDGIGPHGDGKVAQPGGDGKHAAGPPEGRFHEKASQAAAAVPALVAAKGHGERKAQQPSEERTGNALGVAEVGIDNCEREPLPKTVQGQREPHEKPQGRQTSAEGGIEPTGAADLENPAILPDVRPGQLPADPSALRVSILDHGDRGHHHDMGEGRQVLQAALDKKACLRREGTGIQTTKAKDLRASWFAGRAGARERGGKQLRSGTVIGRIDGKAVRTGCRFHRMDHFLGGKGTLGGRGTLSAGAESIGDRPPGRSACATLIPPTPSSA